MHELSIVFSVIETLEDLSLKKELTQISSVTLEFGEVSGILDNYFRDLWEWAIKRSDLLEDADLVIEKSPAVTFCEDCEKTYETLKYGKTCPYCESSQTFLLTGNQMSIKEIVAC